MSIPERLSATELATLAEINPRCAQLALSRAAREGRRWRGVSLNVFVVACPGGRSPIAYEVALDSLPADLQTNHRTAREAAVPAGQAVQAAPESPEAAEPIGEVVNPDKQAEFKLDVIREVLRLRRDEGKTLGRAVWQVSREFRYDYGELKYGKPVSRTQVYRWIEKYGCDGTAGLMRQRRNDRGKRRVVISQSWDKETKKAGIDLKTRRAIATELERVVKGEYHAGERSASVIQMNVPRGPHGMDPA